MSAAAKQDVQAISAVPAVQPSANAVTPMDMIREAAARGDMEVVTKLMDLQDRWEKNEARKAFNESFAAFKSEVVPVIRNKQIMDGPLKGKRYAELFSFVQAVTPTLGRYGLSASWALVRDEKDWIEVACTLEHTQGHARQVKMGGPPDTGGAKNPIQARISTVTYLEKQTLKAVCGIAEQGDDDEATGGMINPLTTEQVEEMRALIVERGANLGAFLKWAKVERLEDIQQPFFKSCMDAIRRAGR